MAHKVYVCYDKNDIEMANRICDTLEKNRISCWLKNRDSIVKDSVGEITKAIENTKAMVLVYSNNSKESQFVNNEVATAFENGKPILVFKIDDTKEEGGLQLFLRKQPWINAYPNPEDRFDQLVEKTKELTKGSIFDIVNEHKIPIIIGVIALIVIVGALGFMNSNNDSQGNALQVNAGDIKLKITDFNVEDVRNQDTSWNYSYSVEGTISPNPDDNSGLIIIVDYYDNEGNLVDTTETPFEDAQIVGSGFLLGSTVSDKNDIKFIDVQLVNKDNVIIAQDDSQVK